MIKSSHFELFALPILRTAWVTVYVKTNIRFSVLFLISLLLAACNQSASYRYKLTLSVDTPNGVRTGSSVAQVNFEEVSYPEHGVLHRIVGDAVYVDLGAGHPPLVALLTSFLQKRSKPNNCCPNWGRDGGPSFPLLDCLYGVEPADSVFEDLEKIKKGGWPKEIKPSNLSDLVTFKDVNDLQSLVEVDRDNLPATLGPGVRWNKITLKITKEPITDSIRSKLPWLNRAAAGELLVWKRPGPPTSDNSLIDINFSWRAK